MGTYPRDIEALGLAVLTAGLPGPPAAPYRAGEAHPREAEPHERHSYFGIAPRDTARLTVTPAGGRTREVAITPWNGAWVVVAPGRGSTLTGYDGRGRVLGSATFGAA